MKYKKWKWKYSLLEVYVYMVYAVIFAFLAQCLVNYSKTSAFSYFLTFYIISTKIKLQYSIYLTVLEG